MTLRPRMDSLCLLDVVDAAADRGQMAEGPSVVGGKSGMEEATFALLF